jgi:hypothetical protein
MYYLGKGTEVQDVSAHVWFNLASTNGAELAEDAKSLVEKRMTGMQISNARKRYNELLETSPGLINESN